MMSIVTVHVVRINNVVLDKMYSIWFTVRPSVDIHVVLLVLGNIERLCRQ